MCIYVCNIIEMIFSIYAKCLYSSFTYIGQLPKIYDISPTFLQGIIQEEGPITSSKMTTLILAL